MMQGGFTQAQEDRALETELEAAEQMEAEAEDMGVSLRDIDCPYGMSFFLYTARHDTGRS